MADLIMTHDAALRDRFWRKVDKSGDCWCWTASLNKQGYGNFMCDIDGGRMRSTLAHRVSWIITNSLIPSGLKVLHRCDNPACVRPDHLSLGTQADNMNDMHAKGRAPHPRYRDYLPRGEGHAFFHRGPKLTRKQVEQIRQATEPQRKLADRFGVSQSMISRILSGTCWKMPEAGSSVMRKPKLPRLQRATLEQRFWSKVHKTEDCWLWGGHLNARGYGTFHIPAKPRWKSTLAHRTAWELTNGTIPPGLGLLHSCDNPGCVRPSHLKPGTQLENTHDCITRGRSRSSHPGETNPMYYCGHKLTRSQAQIIREEVGHVDEIAARWGISRSMVYFIRNGQAWA